MVVHPSMPAKDVKAFIAIAKAKPDAINYGSPGVGALPHLSAELFSMIAGIRMVHVPYKGPATAIIDLMSGHIQAYFINILQSLPPIQAGRLSGMGVTSPQRSPIAPDLPAIAEAGLPGFDMTNWYGMLVPTGTPRETVTRLAARGDPHLDPARTEGQTCERRHDGDRQHTRAVHGVPRQRDGKI